MVKLRPSDLAAEHGLSTQAVRNYERDGFIPPAQRTSSGYRIYTRVHAAALRGFLALTRAYGHATAGEIMHALGEEDVEDALMVIDRGHEQLLRDRGTLVAVRAAVGRLTAEPDYGCARSPGPSDYTIGELARRLRLTPATLRNWEAAGILAPRRDPITQARCFNPADVRDAELTHLLRRGGYPLDHIATVIGQNRTAGGTGELSQALDDWQHKLTRQGLAMLDAAAKLHHYLDLLDSSQD